MIGHFVFTILSAISTNATQIVHLDGCQKEVLVESEDSKYWSPFDLDVIRQNVRTGESLASVFERYGAPVGVYENEVGVELIYRYAEVHSRLYYECGWKSPKIDYFVREWAIRISGIDGFVTKCENIDRRYRMGQVFDFMPLGPNEFTAADSGVRDCESDN